MHQYAMDAKLAADLGNLSESERQVIFSVLKRDEDLRKRDELRIVRLKSELQWLRRRGAIRGGSDPMTSCARCRAQLGKIINRGAPCTICRAKVCKSCRVYARNGMQWFCIVCHKQLEIEAATGEWMNEFVRRTTTTTSRQLDKKGFVSPSEIIRDTIIKTPKEKVLQVGAENDGNKQQPHQMETKVLDARVLSQTLISKLRTSPMETQVVLDSPPPPATHCVDSLQLAAPTAPPTDALGSPNQIPRSPRDRSPSSPRPVPSPRQKSPLLKQRAVVVDHELTDSSCSTVSAASSSTKRRAPPPPPECRSDSGIEPELMQPSPKTSHSESIHSRQSSSCSSSCADSRGVFSFKTESLATTTDGMSDLSDSEVEPATGVIFRKISLKRRKHNGRARNSSDVLEGQCDEQHIVDDDDAAVAPLCHHPTTKVPRSSSPIPCDHLPSTLSDNLFPPSQSDLVVDFSPWSSSSSSSSKDPLTLTNNDNRLPNSPDVAQKNRRRFGLSRSLEVLTLVTPDDELEESSSVSLSSSWTPEASLSAVGGGGGGGNVGDNDFVISRWTDDLRLSSPDYEEDFLVSCCGGHHGASDSSSDILSNVNDKIVPEGEEYRIVFISSASSKSSGLNSVGDDSTSGGSALLMDDAEWDGSVGTDSPPPLPSVPPPELPPEGDCISPTYSLEEVEYIDRMPDAVEALNASWTESSDVVTVLVDSDLNCEVHQDDDGADTSAYDRFEVVAVVVSSTPEECQVAAAASSDVSEGGEVDWDLKEFFTLLHEEDRHASLCQESVCVSQAAEVEEEEEDTTSTFLTSVEVVNEHQVSETDGQVAHVVDEGEPVVVGGDGVEDCSSDGQTVTEVAVEVPVTRPADAEVTSSAYSELLDEEEEEDFFQDGSELEKSDAESQDTIIEDESYSRLRQLAVQERLIEVNREWTSTPENADGGGEEGERSEVVVSKLTELAKDEESGVARIEPVSEEADSMVTTTTPPPDLHKLIAETRALTAASRLAKANDLDALVDDCGDTSILEKYFMTALERNAPGVGRSSRLAMHKMTKVAAAEEEDPVVVPEEEEAESTGADTCSEDRSESDSDVHDVSIDRDDDDDDSDESTAYDDDTDTDDDSTVSSTSSDEGTVYLRMTPVSESESKYRHSLDMSLHTIVEESCEESESERQNDGGERRRLSTTASVTTTSDDPSELERYYQYIAGRLGCPQSLDDVAGGSDEPTEPGKKCQAFSTFTATGNQMSAGADDVGRLQVEVASTVADDGSSPGNGGGGGGGGPRSFSDSEFSDDTMSETGSSCFSEATDSGDVLDDDELARLASSRLEKYFLTGFLGMDAAAFGGLRVSAVASGDDKSSDAVQCGGVEDVDVPFERNDDTIKRQKKKDKKVLKDETNDDDDVLQYIPRVFDDEQNVLEEETVGAAVAHAEESNDNDLSLVSRQDSEKSSSSMDCDFDSIPEVKLEDLDKVVVVEEAAVTVAVAPPSCWDGVQNDPVPPFSVGRGLTHDWKQQSRDSGFIGSSDDLLRESSEHGELDDLEVDDRQEDFGESSEKLFGTTPTAAIGKGLEDDASATAAAVLSTTTTTKELPSATLTTVSSSSSLFGHFRGSTRSSRSSNFGCASDDEAQYIVNQLVTQIAKSMSRSPQLSRAKPPEIEVFESELTKLMQSVPGVDATVKEIVEELSSTDYCSDSYESSDYASSDQEVVTPFTFEVHKAQPFPVGFHFRRTGSGRSWRSSTSTASKCSSVCYDDGQLSEETMVTYQKFMDSLTKMAEHASSDDASTSSSVDGGTCNNNNNNRSGNRSPPTFSKVVSHIREKLTSLMREVQAETLCPSGKSNDDCLLLHQHHHHHHGHHRRTTIVWQKPGSGCGSAAGDELSISSTTSSMTFDSEDSPTDTELSIDSDDPTSAGLLVGSSSSATTTTTTSTAVRQVSETAAAVVVVTAVSPSCRTSGGGTDRATPDEDGGSSAGELERWSSDMTIVDDDVRFTSVHKSEPMLLSSVTPDGHHGSGGGCGGGQSSPGDGDHKRHSLSFDTRLMTTAAAARSGFSSNALQQQQRYHSAGQRVGSAGSLCFTSKASKQRKCRSEWEMWRRSSDSADDAINTCSSSSSSMTISTSPQPPPPPPPPPSSSQKKHASCDSLPSATIATTRSKSDLPTTAGSSSTLPVTSSTATKDRRKHGLGHLVWRQKSGSSMSLREASSAAAAESPSIKQHIQFRSSLQLQPNAKKKEDQQQQSRNHHWLFGGGGGGGGSKQRDKSSSIWSTSVKSCLSSPENLSDVGVVDFTTTTAARMTTTTTTTGSSVGLSDSELSDGGRRRFSKSRHHHHHHHQPQQQIFPQLHPLGHCTMPSSAFAFSPYDPSSSSSLSSSNSWGGKASTLPRSGSSDMSFVPNVSFLHKSQRCLTANTLPHSYTLVPDEQDGRTTTTTMVQSNAAKTYRGSISPKLVAMPPAQSLESPKFRREVRSWPDESRGPEARSLIPSTNNIPPVSVDSPRGERFKRTTVPTLDPKHIPNISIVECPEQPQQQQHPKTHVSRSSVLTGGSDPDSLTEEDIDRLVAMHKNRSLSSLGVCSESMSSVYSAAGGGHYGNVTVRGEVEFRLSYNYVSGALEVYVKQCRDLAPVDIKRNRSDPYVKVYLLPDKSKSGKRKTRVKKHTLNPSFNEVLKFNVTISELETRTLWLTVWHSDMFGRNEFLGEVTLPMGYEAFDDTSPKWYLLQERLGPPEEVFSYKGDLVLSLRFVPPDVTNQKQRGQRNKGSLHVLVKEARNLMAVSANGTSDPFCKCYLLPDKGKGNKQKTPVVKRSCHPKWNHTFVYEDISLESLRERCLELTIWDYDRLTSNDFLGGVRLSLGTGKNQGKKVDWMDSRGEEVTAWNTMLERPNVWVDTTVLLRPTMDHRQTSL